MPDSPLSLLPSLAAIVPADLLLYAVDLAEPVLADQSKKLEFTLLKAYNDALYQVAGSYQPLDADLTTIAGLAHADGNLIVSDGAAWTVESGATARASLGLGSLAVINSPLPIANGGSGQASQQAAIDALTAVAGATNEHVLTKDTGTGNATWKAASGGGGSSLPVADTQTIVMGSADNTKLLRFEVDGFTAGATRVLTPPNADITLAGLEVAQNFTANQGFGITPTAQVEMQADSTTKSTLIVRAPAGALVDTIQVYDSEGDLGFTFNRFAVFSVFNGFRSKASKADTNYVINTDSSVLPGNVQIQSRANASIPMAIIPRSTSQTANMAALLIRRRDGTTPSTGYGSHIRFDGRSSTTDDQSMAQLSAVWNVATHNSAVADIIAQAYYNAAGTFTASEIWRGRGGASPLFAVLGATPVARQAHIVDPSGGGTQDAEARTAINAILVALENFGFLATS